MTHLTKEQLTKAVQKIFALVTVDQVILENRDIGLGDIDDMSRKFLIKALDSKLEELSNTQLDVYVVHDNTDSGSGI